MKRGKGAIQFFNICYGIVLIWQLIVLISLGNVYIFSLFRMDEGNIQPVQRYPWHMTIFTYAEYPKFAGHADDHIEQQKAQCGGTLISYRHILTAASCVEVLWKVP